MEVVKGRRMPYAGNRILAIHSVACILTETRVIIGLIRPITEHQATCFSQALKETRARPAAKKNMKIRTL
jgi:hypothetical protein